MPKVVKPYLKLFVATVLLTHALAATALDDDWYIGLGAGTSWLVPNPVDPSIDDDDNGGSYGTLFFGRDLGRILSIQLQMNSLGETTLTNGETVAYQSADASILYRFYDSRDRGFDPEAFGVSVYGKVVFGGIDRDIGSELPLKIDNNFYFGGGIGAEMYVFGPLALRLEAVFLDQDVQYGSLSLVTRFGGAGPRGRLPTSSGPRSPAPNSPSTPVDAGNVGGETVPGDPVVVESTPVEETETGNTGNTGDSDADGVEDSLDACPASTPGFPVSDTGCGLLNGVLSGIVFEQGQGTLLPRSYQQLDYLVSLLQRFPQAKVQIIAHTDTTGTARDQATITRARLRTVGTYLVRKGISASRLTLRSLGGERPAYDNSTAEGRAANNRIEILERR